MKVISAQKIKNAVADICIRANHVLRSDVLKAIQSAYRKEKKPRARRILGAIILNSRIAKKESLAICQDTGLPVVFLELGQDVSINGNLVHAVQSGITLGYRKGSLRNSIIQDPLGRGKSGFGPGVIHTDIVKGNKLKITVLPKGFGSENKTQVKMFNPTEKLENIESFIIEAVKSAGPDACPPYVVGVGIGGTSDYAGLLAKKALLRKLEAMNTRLSGRQAKLRELEKGLLKKINKLNIGPMGLGGKSSCLAVNIETYPTHIAGLPVAVNISCHALRSATITL